MTRRERLIATFKGLPVDRPAVCFYEINGLDENPADDHPFNIYSHSSWLPLLELARDRSDRIVLRGVAFKEFIPDPAELFSQTKAEQRGDSLFTTKTIAIAGKTLTSRTRRDADLYTTWTLEHFIKSVDDLKLFLQLPIESLRGNTDVSAFLTAEEKVGETGVVMVDTPDPLCLAAGLFDMETFIVTAMTEPGLFHQLLEKMASFLLPLTRTTAGLLPRRPWRIYGPEYAAPPFLRPALFREYVVRYDKTMIEAIHLHDGFVRIHSHGRLQEILHDIVSMGCDGLDPIEPPPQGDMELEQVHRMYGGQLVLFGNIELSDIENLSTTAFRNKVRQALQQGTGGFGKGFVLMPSASPISRILQENSLRNYQAMVRMVEEWPDGQ